MKSSVELEKLMELMEAYLKRGDSIEDAHRYNELFSDFVFWYIKR
jgi:hypothetical protein